MEDGGFAPKRAGGLSARMAQYAARQSEAPARALDETGGFSSGRKCPSCGAMSPAAALACIVCGSALSGPLQYKVVGTTMPVIEVTLEPGQRVYAETGSLGWMTESVSMATVVQGSPWAMLGRAVSGMTPLVTQFETTVEAGVVAFTSRVPGQILPVEVSMGREYILQSGAFLAAQESVIVGPFFNQNLGAILFGGEGFILQKLRGSGVVFVKIDGEVAEYELEPRQVLLVDPGSVAFFEAAVSFSIRRVHGVSNILFSQGLFLAELRGPGRVWLQTMPFAKLVGAIAGRLAESGVRLGGVGAGGRAVGSGLSEVVGSVLENISV